jgi:hypothetical protein
MYTCITVKRTYIVQKYPYHSGSKHVQSMGRSLDFRVQAQMSSEELLENTTVLGSLASL